MCVCVHVKVFVNECCVYQWVSERVSERIRVWVCICMWVWYTNLLPQLRLSAFRCKHRIAVVAATTFGWITEIFVIIQSSVLFYFIFLERQREREREQDIKIQNKKKWIFIIPVGSWFTDSYCIYYIFSDFLCGFYAC